MTIERTELANIEYREKTGELLGLTMAELGAMMAEATFADDADTVERIKEQLRKKQTWRNLV
jgi:hypothetical protein